MKVLGMNRVVLCLALVVSIATAHARPAAVDWPKMLGQQDMVFDQLPQSWTEAPHFGNAMVGSMLYQEGDAIKLQVFRADVHDHRDQTHGWTAYSRPRLQIGHFLLHPIGKLAGCSWRNDLWNAELTGVIKTDQGEIKIRHFTHADDMAIVTELTPSEGEKNYRWTWHPAKAQTTRGGYPETQEQLARFAKKYSDHYLETLKVPYQPNPEGRLEEREGVSVWVQDFLVGGQYATAWNEQKVGETRSHIVSIAHTHPDSTAAEIAVKNVQRGFAKDRAAWITEHRAWWHGYYPQSFISIPDASLQALYWQTIYRLGCTSRAGRCMVDTPGLWFQGRSWPYFTTDWNIQSGHWPVYTANRLDQGQALVDRLHEKQEELIKAVLPVEWRKDSAYLPLAVAWDMVGSRDDDRRYYDLVGNLPWAMHNVWLQYRYSMDDTMLREKVYPLLRRSINFYLHMVEEKDGVLRLPPTYSPETGVWEDCNFDLALLRWGCWTLLKASERLNIDDPLIPRWRQVLGKLPKYPRDDHGFMLGRDKTSSENHQHFSNLLMIYPLHLVNIEQQGDEGVLRRSFERALSTAGPGQRQAMVQAHAGPIGAALGLGNKTLKSLKLLEGDLYPNGLWYESPCIESTLAAANIIQDMLLQSWSDPTAGEAGPIRLFPALPSAWKDVEFHDLRTEGAFLVSAKREGGKTTWVKIKSLAGEPCRVRLGMKSPRASGDRDYSLKHVSSGVVEIDLRKGEEVLLVD